MSDEIANDTPEPHVTLSRGLRAALKAAMTTDEGVPIIVADDAVIALVDVLAGVIATNPSLGMIRTRREYLDGVSKSLSAQVRRYQDLKAKQVVTPERPKLVIVS